MTISDVKNILSAEIICGEAHKINLSGVSVPHETTLIATIHTHPNSNNFSEKDITNSINRFLPSYVVGPNYQLQAFALSTNSVVPIGIISPTPLTDAEKSALRTQYQLAWDAHSSTCTWGNGYCGRTTWPRD